jgi:(p)ppGpp synthase/HD superfamily hydrolase
VTETSTAIERPAQSIVELYEQLVNEQRAAEELTLVRSAYDLALRVFSCSFQRSAKPLIAHVIGTASILAALGRPGASLAAGLLHNVYSTGDFGDGRSGVTETRRRVVERATGREAEEYVYRFSQEAWNLETLTRFESKLDSLEGVELEVLLIFLSNELDRFADLGVLHHSSTAGRLRFVRRCGERAVRLAGALGFGPLERALAACFRATLEGVVPDELRNHRHAEPYCLRPGSHRIALWSRLGSVSG